MSAFGFGSHFGFQRLAGRAIASTGLSFDDNNTNSNQKERTLFLPMVFAPLLSLSHLRRVRA
jgi:hypothetical protein